MGHKYDNFDDAYADFVAKQPQAKDSKAWAYLAGWQAYTDWKDPATAEEIRLLAVSITHLCNCIEYLTNVYAPDYRQSYFYESIYWSNKDPDVPDLTWKAIVEAWVADDFAGRAWTIATIDRMRQILWDEPFNVQWAARPEDAI